MHRIHARLTLVLSVALLAATAAPAAAAPKRITGKLNKPGYTVIALAANGKATLATANKRGKFKLRPPAKRVTLHLRAPNGTYAGPIVVGRKGKRAIVGVKAGARLGTIKVAVRKGYAKVKKKLSKKSIDAKRKARARKGVPIGARVFGRVRSRTASGPKGDADFDGIPDQLDIDDDGDLRLDDFDRSTAVSASQVQQDFHVFSDLTLQLEQTVNHDAGSTDAEIETALPKFGDLLIIIFPGDTAELDCGSPQSRTDPTLGGLVYCSRGGTGRVRGQQPFPGEPGGPYDADGDGFGTLTPDGPPAPGGGPVGATRLHHGATTAQIGAGDVLIQRVTSGGVETQFTSTLGFVFATVPALASYDDGQGNAATVDYPVPGERFNPQGGPPIPGGPGTRSNPFPVAADPGTGEVVVTVRLSRAQRRPGPGEPGYSDPPSAWIDIGGLAYTAQVADIGGNCPASAFLQATPPDPNLKPATPNDAPEVFNNGRGGFVDQAGDQPANAGNTFTYRLNLTRCLATHGLSFNPGDERGMDFQGITTHFGGVAHQPVFFKRQ